MRKPCCRIFPISPGAYWYLIIFFPFPLACSCPLECAGSVGSRGGAFQSLRKYQNQRVRRQPNLHVIMFFDMLRCSGTGIFLQNLAWLRSEPSPELEWFLNFTSAKNERGSCSEIVPIVMANRQGELMSDVAAWNVVLCIDPEALHHCLLSFGQCYPHLPRRCQF